MFVVTDTKFVNYRNSVGSKSNVIITDESEYDNGTATGYDEDSGNEEDEDLEASEEIVLPDDDEDEDEENSYAFGIEDDEEIFQRQLSYPPLAEYSPPTPGSKSVTYQEEAKNVSKKASRTHPRERLGVLTPMEEVTEPPSSAGTEASEHHRSRNKQKRRTSKNSRISEIRQDDENGNPAEQKSILKSKTMASPDRKVKFFGAGSATQSERSLSPTESHTSEYSSVTDTAKQAGNTQLGSNDTIQEEAEDNSQETRGEEQKPASSPTNTNKQEKDQPGEIPENMDQLLAKVASWELGSETDKEESQISIDSEFASILEDIIAELHSWDRLAGTGASSTEVFCSRQDHFANICSQLASCLEQVTPSTVLSNLPQLIPLITTLLNVTQVNFRAQLSSLNTVSVFTSRLKDCKTQTGLKILPNADLTWLVRILCDISSEGSRSVLKSVGTSTLASLVKAAGPEMICEPILFILMGNDEKVPKQREGSGNIVYIGSPGGPPKVKATALDALTFALLTFPRDNFDLDTVGRLACHCLMHSKRRMRQAALECLAVVAHALGPSTALAMFRKFISEEEASIAAVYASMSSDAPAQEDVHFKEQYDPDLQIDPRVVGPPSKIPVPIKVLEAHHKAQAEAAAQQAAKSAPPSPVKNNRGPTPSSAVSARISRHVLPSPNLEELVEYGVKIPANCQLLSRQQMKIGAQEESNDENGTDYTSLRVERKLRERVSSSGDSCSSVSNIEYTLMELEPVLSTRGSGGSRRKGGRRNVAKVEFTMASDVEWILSGTGPIKRCDPFEMLPKELNALNFGSTKYSQRNNTSGTESDFSSVASSQITVGSSDFTMRRINSRSDLLQDSYVQEPALGRYYYPPNNHIISPRTGLNSSDNLSSRYSSKSSYNLLPNKYSVLRNSNQYRTGGHDLISPHVLLPGAYEHPYETAANSYSKTVSPPSTWNSELGSLSKVPPKSKPLEPLTSLRQKYFESTRANSHSDSQQSGSTDAESESDHEQQTEIEVQQQARDYHSRHLNANQNARKPPIAPKRSVARNTTELKETTRSLSFNSQDEVVRRQAEMVARGNQRDYQVYHSRVEMTSPNPAALAPGSSTEKRVDADSAGSNHTRDSGVSMGSLGGSKTPPSVHNTPPLQHRSPSPAIAKSRNNVQLSPKTNHKSFENRGQLHKNWQSTPDVPLEVASNAEMDPSAERLRRDRSGSGSSSRNRNHTNSSTPKPVQASASDANMPVHRKPILARRGQSVTRGGPDSAKDVFPPTPQLAYSGVSRGAINGSGDYLDEYDLTEENVVYNYSSQMSNLSPTAVRNSLSTGNLAKEAEQEWMPRISQSQSTNFDVGINDEAPRTGRISSRREGPFGDVRASIDEDIARHTANTLPMRRNGGAKNGKIVPTKVYKGSFREINSKKASNRNEVFPVDLKPVTSPKHALPMALGQLESADWETNVEGFRQLVRMIRFDPDAIRPDLHNINMSGVRHLTNLRSQVCRAAILCFKELFAQFGRSMEPDCEKIAEKLLDKSADTNKFIREDSGRALEAMMINLTSVKGLACLDLFGTRHRNPAVRSMAARLTATLVDTIGPERCLTELPERLLPMLCKLLQEGSLDTRTSAKAAMSTLMSHPSFYTQLKRFVPADLLRHSQKNIDALQK